MSKKDRNGKKGAGDYEVGYGRPPAKHQYKKGVSGNPSGRRKKVAPADALPFDPAQLPTRLMFLTEAYRIVTFKEGDKVIRLPLIQALMRSAGVKALKGDRFAQRFVADMVQFIEQQTQASEIELLEQAFKYKERSLRDFEICDAKGIERPKLFPHPEDINIDMRTGKVHVDGPMDEKEEENYKKVAEALEEEQYFFNLAKKDMRKEPDNPKHRESALFYQRGFDRLNKLMPKRLKWTLEGRI